MILILLFVMHSLCFFLVVLLSLHGFEARDPDCQVPASTCVLRWPAPAQQAKEGAGQHSQTFVNINTLKEQAFKLHKAGFISLPASPLPAVVYSFLLLVVLLLLLLVAMVVVHVRGRHRGGQL